MADPVRDASRTIITRFASRLKFPQLFVFAAVLFVVDLLIPDLIPFFDEILLGLLTLLLGSIKNKETVSPVESYDKPPEKDITPGEGSAADQK